MITSGAVLVGGLYSVDQAYGRGATVDQAAPSTATPEIQPLSLAAEALLPEALPSELPQAMAGRGQHIQGKQAAGPGQRAGVNLCVNLPDWRRPSEQTQRKQLEQMGRYSGLLQDDTLDSLVKAWWTHEVFSFTTYGLSARTDPHYLSGIWTALDHIWDCYGEEQPQHINNGDWAELWLINHQFVDLQWRDNQYVVTVEPSNQGLQLLMFERRETYENLPVVIMTAGGQEVAVMSGDW